MISEDKDVDFVYGLSSPTFGIDPAPIFFTKLGDISAPCLVPTRVNGKELSRLIRFCFVETVISTEVTKAQMLASIENVPTFYH